MRSTRQETKQQRDHRVYLALINGASVEQAACKGGISKPTLYRRGIKEKADRFLEQKQALASANR